MMHDLKIWPEYFAPLIAGQKTFEIRKDGRNPTDGRQRIFSEDDVLRLREWNPGTREYTGREALANVAYILRGFGPFDGFVIMSLRVFVVPDDDEGGA